MHPIVIVLIPIVLVLVAMVLNSMGLSFDQPASSAEQDPAKRAAAEGEAYRRFFDSQRKQAVARQKRIAQYCWLLMIAIIGSFIWVYNYTVNKTARTSQMASLQTMPLEEGKDIALSVTLKDGSILKYRIQAAPAGAVDAATKDGISKQKVSNWDMEQSGTILSIGESPLTLGVALKVSTDPTAKKD